VAVGLAGALAATAMLHLSWGADATIVRVSVAGDGSQANGLSDMAAVSADGRFVAFASEASNLVGGGPPGPRQIFVRDLIAGTTELVSAATDGTAGNLTSLNPATTGDAHYVVFASDSDNLVANDTNGSRDIFVRDRLLGTTERVSLASDGSEGNNDSETPSISAGGRYVTFTSLASNFDPADSNGVRDVFVHDLSSGSTELVSVASDGTQGNAISGGLGAGPARIGADGRYVVFGSFANNLVLGDTNGFDDIFVRDRLLSTTERVSVGDGEEEGNGHSMYGSISDDGRYVAFHGTADNLVAGDANGLSDVFLRDLQAGTTIPVSDAAGGAPADGISSFAVINGGGTVIAFQSTAGNLVPGDGNGIADIFRYGIASGELTRASVAPGGTDANGASTGVSLSADGLVAAFRSTASNLVAGDTNGVADIFVSSKQPPPEPTATATTTAPPSTPSPITTPQPTATAAATQTPDSSATPEPTATVAASQTPNPGSTAWPSGIGSDPSGGISPLALPGTGAGGRAADNGGLAVLLAAVMLAAGACALVGLQAIRRRRQRPPS